MAKSICFVKQKGGVGASTLCLSIYFSLKTFSNDMKVCLIDLDPQGSILTQQERNDEIEVFTEYDDEKIKPYDIAIIDSPPRLTKEFDPIYNKADILLVPTKVGLFDAVSTIQTFNYLKDKGHEKKTHIILNQAAATSSLNQEFIDILEESDMPYLKTVVHNRMGFNRMLYKNGNIFDQRREKKAHEEIKTLSIEIYSLLIK